MSQSTRTKYKDENKGVSGAGGVKAVVVRRRCNSEKSYIEEKNSQNKDANTPWYRKPFFDNSGVAYQPGFGATPQNPFAPAPQIFSNNVFGATSTAFGQSSAPMFGTAQQQQPLFGSATTSTFGNTNQNAFGSSNIFGQPNQNQQPSLFAAPSTSFGQPNKSSGFNFPSSQPSLFGQPAQQQTTNMFQPSTSTNIFGSSGFGSSPQQTGTFIKFVPATGTDSMQKGGNSQIINTKHHSITCMKEYEGKSFEELRFEDYVAGRKGPQQNTGFGAPAQPFGAQAAGSSLFGQPDNKPAFGATNTFGQSTSFGLGSQPGTSFGKPAFGTTMTSANAFGATNTSTNVFGATAKPFGAQPTQPMFGATQQQPATTFGTQLFGQQTSQAPNTNIFKPAQPFPAAQPVGFGQTPASTQAASLFQPAKPQTGFSVFGTNNTNTTTNTFGQTNTGFGGFNTFAKPVQNTFNQPVQPSTGFTLGGSNLFGNKPAFGTTTTGGGLFGGTVNTFATQPQQPQQQPQLTTQSHAAEVRSMLSVMDPYGLHPHLEGLSPHISATHYVTNPKELDDVISKQQRVVSPNQNTTKKIKVASPIPGGQKWYAFETAYEPEPISIASLERRNPKKLNIKKTTKKPEPLVVFQGGKIVETGSLTNVGAHVASLPIALKAAPKQINVETTEAIIEPLPASPSTSSLGSSSVVPAVPLKQSSGIESLTLKLIEQPIFIDPAPKKDDKKDETPKSSKASLERPEPPVETCGIVCTRPEYYTIPPLEEIHKYKNDDNTCLIKGFTIGRIGYGNVYFPDVMDVTNLNIDELVHFRYREICVYPDDKIKPPLGEGLNRKAQVTLDRVYPKKDNGDGEFEEDADILMNMHFGDMLRSACVKADTTFVDYRPETGSWVFTVSHFSVYGFTESDEDDCAPIDEKKAVEVLVNTIPKPVLSTDVATCAGIINTRPDYFTVPALDQIDEFRTGSMCKLKDFSVGRVGFGRAYFPDVIDIANTNIDKHVQFEHKQVCIYPYDDDRPVKGTKLNRRAVVALENVFPTTDPIDFIDVLKIACEKLGAKFRLYIPSTGTWLFDVTHFSKYGLSDSEEKRCCEEFKRRRALRDQQHHHEVRAEVDQSTSTSGRRGLGGVSQEMFSSPIFERTDSSMIDVDMQIYANMRSISDTRESSNLTLMKEAFYPSNADQKSPKSQMHVFDVLTNLRDITAVKNIQGHPKEKPKPAKKKRREPLKMYALKNINCRVPLTSSLIPAKCEMDLAIFKGRSFKVGWGRGFTLATVLCEESNNQENGVNIVEKEYYNPSSVLLLDVSKSYQNIIVENVQQDDPFAAHTLEYCMEAVLQESSCKMQNVENSFENFPLWSVNITPRLIQQMCHIWKTGRSKFPNNFRLKYYLDIFELCLSFWGPINEKDDDETVRKELFNKWLLNVTSELVTRDLQMFQIGLPEPVKKILVHLSGHQIEEAAKLAFESDLPNLSLLISQLNLIESTKLSMQDQMYKWRDVGALEFIDADTLKVYLLICGAPYLNEVNVFDYVDWLRALAMHFWYMAPTEAPLNIAVDLYEQACNEHSYAVKPHPIYSSSTSTWDVLYQLIRMYCGKERQLNLAISPTTHTADPIDFRLSWLLMQTLFSLDVGIITKDAMYHIITMFSTQLEQQGLYKWAVFVSLFIPDISLRKNLVTGLLCRNIKDDLRDHNTEKILVKDFNVPMTWIHELKARRSLQLEKFWPAYQHFVYARLWKEAHDIYFVELAPSLICNGHFEATRKYFRKTAEHNQEISNYQHRMGILMEFVKFWTSLHNHTFPKSELIPIYKDMCDYIGAMKYFPCETPGLTVAISEVSKNTARFFNDVLKEMSPIKNKYIAHASKQLAQFVMPVDYKFEEVTKFVMSCQNQERPNHYRRTRRKRPLIL